MKKGLIMFEEEHKDNKRFKISKKRKTKKSNHIHEYTYFIIYVGEKFGSTSITTHGNKWTSQIDSGWTIYKLCKECGESAGWDLSGFIWGLEKEEFDKALKEGTEFKEE